MTKKEKFLLAVVLLVSGGGAFMYVQTQKNKALTSSLKEQVQVVQPATNTTSNTSVSAEQTNTVSSTNTTQQVDTSKKVTVGYTVPSGDTEKLTVTVTLKDNLISDITFVETPSNPQSQEYYQSFSSKFSKSSLIGKSLSSVSLSRVGGASLTTNAFNKAIAQL